MLNNLQALDKLKQSANEQEKRLTNTIKEIHQQSLQSLNESLLSLHNTKLEKIESNIKDQNSDTLENIDFELEKMRKNKWIIYASIATTSLIAGIAIDYLYIAN